MVLLGFVWMTGMTVSVPVHAQQIEQSLVPTFQEAEALLRDGQYEAAVDLLEPLVEQQPETYVFFDRLLRAYDNLKRYDAAVALIEDRRAAFGASPSLLAEQARILYLSGAESDALATWQAAIEAAPAEAQTYRTVYRSMTQVRLLTDAVEVLDQGRERLGDASAFRFELANLYGATGQFAAATTEYLAVLADDDRRVSFVRNRMARLLEQDGALEAALPVVEAVVRDEPLYHPYRALLAWLYLEDAQYAAALDAHRALDRLEDTEGRELLGFAEAAIDGHAYASAIVAYEEVLDRYPDSRSALRARLGLAATFEHWGDHLTTVASMRPRTGPPRDLLLPGTPAPDTTGAPAPGAANPETNTAAADTITAPQAYREALAAYQRFLALHENSAQARRVLQRLGRLHLEITQDYDAATEALETLLETHVGTEEAEQALFDRARVALRRNNLDEARIYFSRVVDTVRTGELANEARLELARLHFYRGAFDASKTILSTVRTNTSSDVANDAVELRLLLIDGEGPDSLHTPLRTLASARLLARQQQPAEALARLDTLLASYAGHPVADEAQLTRGRTLVALERFADARDALRALADTYPRSPQADRALFEAAMIEEQQLGVPAAALETYLDLLDRFPGSLLAADARERIRALQGQGVEQET
jgi:tetratricopeptide (TPR) repeat protein